MELLKVVKGIHQRFNPELQIEGILFTMDNCRYNNAKRNKQAIKTTYGNDIKIFEQTIPRTESLAAVSYTHLDVYKRQASRTRIWNWSVHIWERRQTLGNELLKECRS